MLELLKYANFTPEELHSGISVIYCVFIMYMVAKWWEAL
jgi:hypothetical protein